MSRTRTKRQRRRGITITQWIALTSGVLLSALLLVVLYVRSADAEYRQGESQALELARTQAGIVQADRVLSYTWDETLWIVIGKNEEDRDLIVWQRESGIETAYLEEGFAEAEIIASFQADRPSARLIRILPGWFHGIPVWELRYYPDPDSSEQGLDFYSFRTGKLLKTYTLLGE